MNTRTCLLFVALTACGPKLGQSWEAKRPTPSVAQSGYDAELSTYPYPFEVHERRFTSQGQPLKMAYMDVSPAQPNGRTVVLLHGKNFSGAYWDRTIRALTERGYRVVVPDQIGFGKSSKPAHFQFTFHALADHTRALLDELKLEHVAVVAHSMGGMLGTRFALLYPERVEQLVLVNPIGLEDWGRSVPYSSIDSSYQRELVNTRDKIREYMRQSYFAGSWKSEYEPLIDFQAGWTEGPDRERVAWVAALTFDMVFTQPVVHDFARLKTKTLLIIGTRDRTAIGKQLVPPEVAQTLGDYEQLGKTTARAIPGAQLVELPGVGHMPQVEAFDAYLEALSGFLAGK
jgi:pimeloyl-ACP methyl ester carboxylesterase